MRKYARDPGTVARRMLHRDVIGPLGQKGEGMTDSVKSDNEKPCRISELQVGDTFFTIVSVQSETARDTAYDKVKKLILSNVNLSGNFTENR